MYASAKLNAKFIGYDIANVLKILTNDMGVGFENIHLIGHGLGAHIVGYTGKKLSGKISRITGRYTYTVINSLCKFTQNVWQHALITPCV